MSSETPDSRSPLKVSRIAPILWGLLHALVSVLIVGAVIASNPAGLLAGSYVWAFVFIPAVLVPVSLVVHRLIKKTTVWWAVALGCVISIVASLAHLWIIIVTATAI